MNAACSSTQAGRYDCRISTAAWNGIQLAAGEDDATEVDSADGRRVEATYPMEQVRTVLAHAAWPGRRGKVLLLPNPHLLAGITPAPLG